MVTGGAFTVKSYEKKGTTAFIPDPNYWGEKAHVQAVALTYYTNADSMIADLKATRSTGSTRCRSTPSTSSRRTRTFR